MRTYCVTGVAGYLGGLLARRLASADDTRVVGIDLQAPADLHDVSFHECDIRNPGLTAILAEEAVDVLVHLAFYTPPEGDPEEARSVNVDGAKNVLQAVRDSAVRRLVVVSSSAAYGSHDDNPLPLRESDPLRPNYSFYYSAHKAEQEMLVRRFAEEHPEVETVVLRPCVVIGPHINNPTGDSLKQKVMIAMRDPEVPVQLIYEDDVAEALFLAATGRATGVFNVGGSGMATFREIGLLLHKKVVRVPYGVLRRLASFARALRLSPVGGRTVTFIRNPIVTDTRRFARTFGFRPRFDTIGAVLEFDRLMH
jgi:UDP-glucose 4-epimerase